MAGLLSIMMASCGKSYREGTAGAKLLEKTDYCSNKCRIRLEDQ